MTDDMKTSNAAGPSGTESPVKSPVGVPRMSVRDLPWDPDMVLNWHNASAPSETGSVLMAYLTLLRMPHGVLRHTPEAQQAMSSLRDLLAAATHREAETIQDACEFYVAQRPA